MDKRSLLYFESDLSRPVHPGHLSLEHITIFGLEDIAFRREHIPGVVTVIRT